MHAKHARLRSGGPNPLIDAVNRNLEADIQGAMVRAALKEQEKGGRP